MNTYAAKSATDRNLSAKASSRKAKTTFTVFSQPPERGSCFNIEGKKAKKLNGIDKILGTRQSGELDFKTGDIIKDREVLQWAVEDRDALTKEDPSLSLPQNKALKLRIMELYQKQWHLINLG